MSVASAIGHVEQITPEGISGWCVDACEVEVRVNGIRLGSVRADRPRQVSSGCRAFGFTFPLPPRVFGLLPHMGMVEVFVNNSPLPLLKGCNPRIENAGSTGEDLTKLLNEGYIYSPKKMELFQPLKGSPRGVRTLALLAQCEDIFYNLTGRRYFVCYGTLLGLVREGGYIPHDDDVDVAFIGEAKTTAEAVSEFLDVVAVLQAHGEDVKAASGGCQFHWMKLGISLDVFMGWIEDSHLYMYNVGGRLSADKIFPLRRGDFEGRSVPMPNDPKALLELIYGSDWNVPNPSFQWWLTPALKDKMQELRSIQSVQYWPRFYNGVHTRIPSPFAAAVALELEERRKARIARIQGAEDKSRIIDLGCGNGRDSLFFASLGHQVVGLDREKAAVESSRSFSESTGMTGNAEFRQMDLADQCALAEVIQSQVGGSELVIYARFLLHAVTEDVEESILSVLSECLPEGGRCYFEFRTRGDEGRHKNFGQSHYRRFIDLARFVDGAVADGVMECVYKVEGRGMAKFRGEDPMVGRVTLRRPQG